MEKTIDRREYRRQAKTQEFEEEEKVEWLQKRIKKIAFQTLGAASFVLIISFLKFFHCIEILDKVKIALNQELSLASIQDSGQKVFKEACVQYKSLNSWVESMLANKGENWLAKEELPQSGILLESGDLSRRIGDEVTKENEHLAQSGENNNLGTSGDFETAVEGINQMSEDANYIKSQYKLVVPTIGTITSVFGVRNSQNPIVGHYHSGLDIAANTGTQVLAALDGEVIEAKTDTYYGKYLKIKNGDIEIIYAHCSKLLAKEGDKVKKGSLIAYVGNTGNSTGPHLHFEVRYQNRLVNPEDILELKK